MVSSISPLGVVPMMICPPSHTWHLVPSTQVMVELKGLAQSATNHPSLINKMVRKDKEHRYLSHKAKYCQKQKWYLGWYGGPVSVTPVLGRLKQLYCKIKTILGYMLKPYPSPKENKKRLKHLEPWPFDPHGSVNAALWSSLSCSTNGPPACLLSCAHSNFFLCLCPPFPLNSKRVRDP